MHVTFEINTSCSGPNSVSIFSRGGGGSFVQFLPEITMANSRERVDFGRKNVNNLQNFPKE